MTETTFPKRALKVLIPIFGSTCIILPLLISLAHPRAMQSSDFLTAFYPAGKLLVENRAADLYPLLSSSNFVESPYNVYVHQLLNGLAPDFVAVYMYPPLTAVSFIPFSIYSPTIALLCWQLISVLALIICAKLMSTLTGTKTLTTFFLCLLFLPVTQTIFIGQLGILLGLLPLTVGYFLLVKDRERLAGLAWSTLLFKPQFLPIAVFVALVLASKQRFRCLIGLTTGLAVLTAFTIFFFGEDVCSLWLHSLQLSIGIDSNPIYGYATNLKCSLPAAVLALLPSSQRPMLEPFVNLIACLIAGHGIWTMMHHFQKSKSQVDRAQVTTIFLAGMLLIPLFQPHFFYYDLCVFALAGALLLSDLAPFNSILRQFTLVAWLTVNSYMLVWMFVSPALAQPLIIVLGDALIYFWILRQARLN